MAAEQTATFAEHVGELRRRLMWTMLCVAIGAVVGYLLQDRLLSVLQRPLNEQLYYTNPTGAFSFVIKVAAVFGIIAALPMALYQGFAFFEPLIKTRTRRLVVWYVFVSVLLAAGGLAFAYFISLPAALHFLVNFGGNEIESLITANEYFNFVLAYLAGFALLFQLPLILTGINRITPLTPNKLIGGTRYVILGSFVIAAIITPTPDPLNQLLMAGPVILLYFLSASVIALKNHSRGRKKHEEKIPAEPVAHVRVPAPSFAQPVNPITNPRPVVRPTSRRVNDIIIPGRNVAIPAYHQRHSFAVPQKKQIQPKPQLISDFIPLTNQ